MTTSESPSTGTSKSRRVVRIALPVAILIVGVAAFAALRFTKETPSRLEQPPRGPLVETLDCPVGVVQITVDAQGSVRPAIEIDLVPQVSGVVIWKSPLLESGGYFRRDDLLAQIDPLDYELAVETADAELARAQYSLEIARGEAHVARDEWERMTAAAGTNPADMTAVNPLVLHVPQLKAAEASLQAARARRDEVRLRLERTKLRASFEGRVRQTTLDRGQYVQAGQPVARIYSIERAEIVVPVPDDELAWLELPDPPSGFAVPDPVQPAEDTNRAVVRQSVGEGGERYGGSGAEVSVSGRYGGQNHEWSGRLARAEGEFDRQSRMVNLIVEVDDPYGAGSAPLTAGMFVDVAIKGPPCGRGSHPSESGVASRQHGLDGRTGRSAPDSRSRDRSLADAVGTYFAAGAQRAAACLTALDDSQRCRLVLDSIVRLDRGLHGRLDNLRHAGELVVRSLREPHELLVAVGELDHEGATANVISRAHSLDVAQRDSLDVGCAAIGTEDEKAFVCEGKPGVAELPVRIDVRGQKDHEELARLQLAP